MSSGRRTTIGFDRTIHLEWLDIAAARLSRGEAPSEVRKAVWDILSDLIPGDTNSSGRGKTLTVLSGIWLTVPDQVRPLRDKALKCLTTTSGQERVAVHWAMTVATHPFFFDVATNVGKLLALHGQASRSQIKRRMTESWGDRSTLERTIQHVLKSMTQWGLLRPGPVKGTLLPAGRRVPISGYLAELLVHGVLLSQGAGMTLPQAADHPALFPFRLQLNAAGLRENKSLRVQRQGDQSDFVEIV